MCVYNFLKRKKRKFMSVPGFEPPASDDLKNVLKRFHSLRMRVVPFWL